MEIQRNKRLNWAFIVLAVLAIGLRLVSLVSRNFFQYEQVRCLLSLACAVLPILAIVCSRRKTVSLTCVIAYFAVCAVMTYQAYQKLFSKNYVYDGYWWETSMMNLDGIVSMFLIGLPLLRNSIGKRKGKKELGFACLILGIIEIAVVALLWVTDRGGSMCWGGFFGYDYSYWDGNWDYHFQRFKDCNLPYILIY